MSHVEKRVQAGRVTYRARYRDPSGRERMRSFARMTDARRFLVGVEDSKLRGAYVPPEAGRDVFAEWAERWYRTTADLKPGTRRPTASFSTTRSSPTSAARPWPASTGWRCASGSLPSLRVACRRLASETPTRCSPRSSPRPSRAGDWPATRPPGCGCPRGVDREMLFLDAAQVEVLADAIGPHHRVLVYFLAYTGLRFGEAVALRVYRLDLLRGTCEVVESATEVGSQLEWGPTKTDERRTVRLPRFLCDLLAAHLADQPRDLDALVFTAPMGGPLRERKFLHGQLKPAARRAGLPGTLRAHDLRHTAASLLIRQGASVKAVQKTLGHRSAVVTLDRYGHLWPDELEDLAERLDRARAAAVAPPTRPTGGPAVVQLRKRPGQ